MKTYTAEQKAAVLAQLALGTPLARAAKDAGLPRSTVQRWWAGQSASLPVTQKARARETGDDIGELVYEFLVTGLKAAIVAHRTFADPEWLKGQGAKSYRLYGTLVDKLVLVARGVEQGSPGEPADNIGNAGNPPALPEAT